MLAALGQPVARAGVTTIACDGQNDIAEIQGAVDSASSGDTVQLSGTCDFSAALPHGGGVASIAAAAVLVRPGTPVTDLVIQSAPTQTASVVGSGTQTAFAVAPGNDRVTIRGLRFVNLARPIVVLGASDVTVGEPGAGVPAPAGNRIVGDGQLNSAVLAVADDGPMSVRFGAGGVASGSPGTLTPSRLDGLTVAGNQITYSPPGPGDPAGQSDVVAIDVRQANGGIVDGVQISENAVAMFASEIGTLRHNGVRVEGLAAVSASNPPSRGDYRIQNVTVAANNLGRFEELDPSRLVGVDADQRHAAGRVGVLLERVADFAVGGNRVRARLSAGGLGAPGGGIVVSDSSFGTISANDVVVSADPGVPSTSDLGGVAVVEGIPAVFGASAVPDQATTDVQVTGNTVGQSVQSPFVTRRGVVVSGADLATVWNNTVVSQDGPSLLVGADVRNTAGQSLPRRVTRSVLCSNTLDGTADNPFEVSFLQGATPSTGNAFPTGSAYAGNGECAPTVAVSPAPPTPVQPGGTLTATGRAWAVRPVTIVVADELGASVTKAGTADDLGTYSVVLFEQDLAPLSDGLLSVTAIASHGATLSRASAPSQAQKNLVVDPPAAGTMVIDDGDGFTNALETVFGVPVEWQAALNPRPTAIFMWVVDAQGNTPSGCGPWLKPASGSDRIPYECGAVLPQGGFEVRVRWQATDGESSPVVTDASVKDSVLPSLQISAPAEGSTVTTTAVTVSGTASEPGTVTVRTSSWPYQVLGTASVDASGAWSTPIVFAEGRHSMTAFVTDDAANDGPTAPVRTFTVNGNTSDPGGEPPPPDITPPGVPVITSPASGSLRPPHFAVGGTAEPLATVYVFVNGSPQSSTTADAQGNWAAGVFAWTGTHSIHAVAGDAAGNLSDPSASITVEVDATPPALAIETPADTIFTPARPVLIEGTASDVHDVAFVIVEYWAATNADEPVDVTVAACIPACPSLSVSWRSSPSATLLPGAYFARVVAADRLGNLSVANVRFFKVP